MGTPISGNLHFSIKMGSYSAIYAILGFGIQTYGSNEDWDINFNP